MKRWVTPALILLVATAAGAAGWRMHRLSEDLEATRARNQALELQVGAVTAIAEAGDERLRKVSAELKAADRRLVQTERRLRDRQPCPGHPKLILTPSSGRPGTRVRFEGYCFVGPYWSGGAGAKARLLGGYGLFIMNPAQDVSDPDYVSNGGPECELIAGTHPNRLALRRNGTARGYLTIPAEGGCFQEDRAEAVSPGEYGIGLGCHTCGPLATFSVTSVGS